MLLLAPNFLLEIKTGENGLDAHLFKMLKHTGCHHFTCQAAAYERWGPTELLPGIVPKVPELGMAISLYCRSRYAHPSFPCSEMEKGWGEHLKPRHLFEKAKRCSPYFCRGKLVKMGEQIPETWKQGGKSKGSEF